jgi:hypothetical protein
VQDAEAAQTRLAAARRIVAGLEDACMEEALLQVQEWVQWAVSMAWYSMAWHSTAWHGMERLHGGGYVCGYWCGYVCAFYGFVYGRICVH